MFDVLIKNGEIIDGTGKPAYKADIAIQDEKITDIGILPEGQAKQVIDAKGKTITPGFIDIHSHTDCELMVNPRSESKIRQGITTDVSGNCGFSPFPIGPVGEVQTKTWMQEHGLQIDWEDLGGFYKRLEERGVGTNYCTFVGHGALRTYCMGEDNRPPTPDELNKMEYEMEKVMEQGAIGLTTGLIYPPGCFAKMDEVIELAKIAAKKGGIYASHMRSEGQFLLESITETLTIGRRAKIPVQVSHLKASGKRNWGKAQWAIELIEIARDTGMTVYSDRYPYIASSTSLKQLLPKWSYDGGMDVMVSRLKDPTTRQKILEDMLQNVGQESGYEDTLIAHVNTDKNKKYEGMQLQEIAKEKSKPIHETVFDLLIEEEGQVAAIFFSMSEEDSDQILSQEWVGIGSDSGSRAPYPPLNDGKPHPRTYGTFPRVIAHYSKEKKLFDVVEAVRKMTGLNAEILGLKDRGKLEKNCYADIVIMDLEKIKDNATFIDPHQYPAGIEYVLVNGKIAIEQGSHTGVIAGKILRH